MEHGLGVSIIQWSLSAEEYADPSAFAEAVHRRINGALQQGGRKLLVFPELSGLWLQLGRLLPPGKGLISGFLHLAARSPAALFTLLSRHRIRILRNYPWEEHIEHWLGPFREAARKYGLYVCPGSSFLPFHIPSAEQEGIKAGGSDIFNAACMISPEGTVLGWRRKIHLTPIEQRLGVRPGSPMYDLSPFQTDYGMVGIALCLDGFYEDVVFSLDRQGARIILQPSANPVDWYADLPHPGGKEKQYEQWLKTGIGYMIQGREHIRYAVNPMDATKHPVLKNSGCSSIWENSPRSRLTSRYPGLLKIASDPYGETILHADLPADKKQKEE